MKLLVALCVLVLVTHSLGCIYIRGHCYKECEEGTHSYGTGCGPLTPEATCDNPKPVTDTRGNICDFSACYCNEPTVRDTVSGKCVNLDQCPKREEKIEENKDEEKVENIDVKKEEKKEE